MTVEEKAATRWAALGGPGGVGAPSSARLPLAEVEGRHEGGSISVVWGRHTLELRVHGETQRFGRDELASLQLSRASAFEASWLGRLLRRPGRRVHYVHVELRPYTGDRLRLSAAVADEGSLAGLPALSSAGELVPETVLSSVVSTALGLGARVASWRAEVVDAQASLARRGQGALLFPEQTRRGRWVFTDASGRRAAPRSYDRAFPFQEGLARVWRTGEGWGFVDLDGTEQIQLEWSQAGDFRGGRARVARLDPDGNLVWTWLDERGVTCRPPGLEFAQHFSEGLAGARASGSWGFVSADGSWAIEPQFDDVLPFSEGYAAAALAGQWGYVDRCGAWVVEPRYERVTDVVFGEARAWSRGVERRIRPR